MAVICPNCGNYISDEELEAMRLKEKAIPDQCKDFAESGRREGTT